MEAHKDDEYFFGKAVDAYITANKDTEELRDAAAEKYKGDTREKMRERWQADTFCVTRYRCAEVHEGAEVHGGARATADTADATHHELPFACKQTGRSEKAKLTSSR